GHRLPRRARRRPGARQPPLGVEPYEPRIFLAALVVLAGAAFAAAVIPARRTTAIDPIRALRAE
ncbi:MAG TPA: hypothetical protein VOA80_13430, partial [Thermoanaerobaculia bacterium]|nr:hypothetical protein [Thermoanaerobaculia bacterium]